MKRTETSTTEHSAWNRIQTFEYWYHK